MNPQLTNVAVLGSTGSIGRNALEVIAASGNRLQATVLSAYSNVELLLEQARQIRPRFVVAVDPAAAGKVDWSTLPKECTLLTGAAALAEVVRHAEVDVVLTAIVGRAGLEGTWAAIDAGKTIALANKETLVMAGPLATTLAKEPRRRHLAGRQRA